MTKLYDAYQQAKLYAALSGNFDFDADYEAYEAHVTGDRDTLARLTDERIEKVGKPSFTKNPEKGSRTDALGIYEREQAGQRTPPSYPAHFVGTEGKQGTDSFKANFSDKRPKKVATPFGTDADNSEALS